ncbi:MAG: CHASE2 domain-containing protein [Burkholderiaceae bacterium]
MSAGSSAPLAARWREDLRIAAVLAVLAALAAWSGWTWRIDRVVYDLGLVLWQRGAPPDITIVAIDDASVEAIGRWPWPRTVHATLLRRLAQARPRAVSLDLVLSEADPDPAHDRLLADALRAAAPVVLPVVWQAASLQALAPLQPTPALRDAARLGAAEAPVDDDGVLRHAFLRAGPADAPYPHVALALLQAGGESPHPALRAEPAPATLDGSRWRRDGRFLIRYAGAPGTVDRVSYVDVLRGAVPPERLAGRYVLVGPTAQGLGDTLATPVNMRHQAMPGVEVLAHTLYTLRSGDVMRVMPMPMLAAVSAALVALLVLAFGRFGARVALPLALASVPVAFGAGLLALGLGWWASPVPFALVAGLAYPLWSWRRLERAVAGIDREIARITDEPLARGAEPLPRDEVEARLVGLQRAGDLVREARQFLADALAALPTAMLLADDHARVLLANPKAAALFEVPEPEEMQGLDLVRLLGEFTPVDDHDWAQGLARLELGAAGVAVEARLAGQGDFIVHTAAVPVRGRRCTIVAIADVEPVKRAQREREEALAFVSHDLRSPASSIVLLADLHLAGERSTPLPELLLELRRLATRTLEMSEAFVRAADARDRVLRRRPWAVAELVDEALADQRAQALATGVTLQVAIDDDRAPLVVDRALVARAIGNLVSNAVRHSPRNAVVLIEARRDASGWCIAVIDRGLGLSDEQRQHIALGREGLPVQRAGGVGLGLLFVQRVAHRHGGTVTVQTSADGIGARFELHLPDPPPASGNA